MLETGEWQVEGNEVVIKVSSSATVIEMSLGADAKRLDHRDRQRSTGTAGQAESVAGRRGPGCTARSAAVQRRWTRRAEQDPVVRRMKEKFGAEIRTIIDYKEKR